MMFIILTHDNHSALFPFSLFLSFVTNSPVAEKSFAGSTDMGSIVIRFFLKENVRYLVWTCRDPIFSDSRDPVIIFADSRDPNRFPKTL